LEKTKAMSQIARIINGQIVYSEDHAPTITPNETEARANRQNMKTQHRKDLLQKNQVDFYKAYPEQAKDLPPETRRLLS
jgi:hypothetical protein